MISQEVSCEEIIYDELKDLYNSDVWKNSVAYDAPVIDPEDTKKLLKELLPLIPKDGEDEPENGKHHRHSKRKGRDEVKDKVFEIMQRQVNDLINYEDLEKKGYNCHSHDFNFMYNPTASTNYLSSPERNKPYGANIMAYLLHGKQNLLKLCAIKVNEKLDLPTNDLKQIEQLARDVFPIGFSGTPYEFVELNDKSEIIIEGIANYLIHTVPGVKKGENKKEFTSKFKEMVKICNNFMNNIEHFGFIDVALIKDDMSSFVLEEPSLEKLAYEMKVCKNISGKNLIEAVESSAGYSNFKGKLKSIVAPYF